MRRREVGAVALHEILILLHAGAALLCFAFGALTLAPRLPPGSRGRLFPYYLGMLVAMIAFLAGAILSHIGQLDPVQRGIFTGLFVLSLYMLLRGSQAHAALSAQRGGGLSRYADHVGFTSLRFSKVSSSSRPSTSALPDG